MARYTRQSRVTMEWMGRAFPMLVSVLICGCSPDGADSLVEGSEAGSDTSHAETDSPDTTRPDTGSMEIAMESDGALAHETASDAGSDTGAVVADTAPSSLDLHDVALFDNPTDLADWPVTTTLTEVDFVPEGVHVEFSKKDGAGSWPDVTPPGWTGPLEYTLGFAEYIDGKWYGSAAIEFWRGLAASGGNVAEDVPTKAQCTAFGKGSSCQIAKNWYYDGRWGNLQGYQPKTGELIGVFVVAGNLRGVKDGSQSPVRERSNVVLVPMPALAGAKHAF